MSDQLTHPSPEVLGAFSLGQLPPEEAAVIESHVSECDPCCNTIVSLSSDDTFVALLQEARQLPTEPTVALEGGRTSSPSLFPDVPGPLAEHPRYEVLGLIGKGGMGDVYKVRHRMMDRTVALKIINRAWVCQPEAVDRFHREVKTAARLAHPNIVTAHDAEQAGDVHFLVMEYVDGVDLAHTVKQQGALSIANACDYVRQAAIGLQYAHEMGMVHRDIKPHNLMVTADGTVKILDFGLASLGPGAMSNAETVDARDELTVAGSIMGSPDFISPEQAEDAHRADIRSDIYSLGSTLYYLLSGTPPFPGGSVTQKLKSHTQAEPEPIQCIRMDVPDELAEVLQRMTAKDPAERFQTPAEVVDALSSVAASLQPAKGEGKQPPVISRSRQQAGSDSPRGRWTPAMATGAALFALVVAAVAFYIQTDYGSVRVVVEDPDAKVVLRCDDGHRMLDIKDYDITVGLRSGENSLLIKHGDLEFETDSFSVRRGDQVVVRVSRTKGNVEVRAGDVLIGREQLPLKNADHGSATALTEVRRTAEPVRVIPHADPISSLAYLPDGTLVTASSDKLDDQWKLYFTSPLSERIENGVPARTKDVACVAATADGKWVATGSRLDHKVVLWDALRREPVETWEAGNMVHSVAFSPDSKLLAAASWDGSAKVWSVETHDLVKTLDGYGRVHRVRFSPDGRTLAVSETPSGRTDLYDTRAWRKRTSFTNGYGIGEMSFSADSTLIATGGNGLRGSEPWKMWVRIWNATTGEKMLEFKEMRNAVSAVVISPDSRYLIAVGGNWGTDPDWGGEPHEADAIRIWDLSSHQLVAEFDGHDRWVRDVAFTPDGKHFATISKEVKVWDLEALVGPIRTLAPAR